jgi:hypothetical protein
MKVAQLMNSPAGRVARAVAGLARILAGALTGGLVLALIGLAPLAAGAAGVCVAAPLLRAPFRAQ